MICRKSRSALVSPSEFRLSQTSLVLAQLLVVWTTLGCWFGTCSHSLAFAQDSTPLHVFVPEKDLPRVGLESFVPIPIDEIETLFARETEQAVASVPRTHLYSFVRVTENALRSEKSILEFEAADDSNAPWLFDIGDVAISREQNDFLSQLENVPSEEPFLRFATRPSQIAFAWTRKGQRSGKTLDFKFQIPRADVVDLILALPSNMVISPTSTTIFRRLEAAAIPAPLQDQANTNDRFFQLLPAADRKVGLQLQQLENNPSRFYGVRIDKQESRYRVDNDSIVLECNFSIGSCAENRMLLAIRQAVLTEVLVDGIETDWGEESGRMSIALPAGHEPSTEYQIQLKAIGGLDKQSRNSLFPRVSVVDAFVLQGVSAIQDESSFRGKQFVVTELSGASSLIQDLGERLEWIGSEPVWQFSYQPEPIENRCQALSVVTLGDSTIDRQIYLHFDSRVLPQSVCVELDADWSIQSVSEPNVAAPNNETTIPFRVISSGKKQRVFCVKDVNSSQQGTWMLRCSQPQQRSSSTTISVSIDAILVNGSPPDQGELLQCQSSSIGQFVPNQDQIRAYRPNSQEANWRVDIPSLGSNGFEFPFRAATENISFTRQAGGLSAKLTTYVRRLFDELEFTHKLTVESPTAYASIEIEVPVDAQRGIRWETTAQRILESTSGEDSKTELWRIETGGNREGGSLAKSEVVTIVGKQRIPMETGAALPWLQFPTIPSVSRYVWIEHGLGIVRQDRKNLDSEPPVNLTPILESESLMGSPSRGSTWRINATSETQALQIQEQTAGRELQPWIERFEQRTKVGNDQMIEHVLRLDLVATSGMPVEFLIPKKWVLEGCEGGIAELNEIEKRANDDNRKSVRITCNETSMAAFPDALRIELTFLEQSDALNAGRLERLQPIFTLPVKRARHLLSLPHGFSPSGFNPLTKAWQKKRSPLGILSLLVRENSRTLVDSTTADQEFDFDAIAPSGGVLKIECHESQFGLLWIGLLLGSFSGIWLGWKRHMRVLAVLFFIVGIAIWCASAIMVPVLVFLMSTITTALLWLLHSLLIKRISRSRGLREGSTIWSSTLAGSILIASTLSSGVKTSVAQNRPNQFSTTTQTSNPKSVVDVESASAAKAIIYPVDEDDRIVGQVAYVPQSLLSEFTDNESTTSSAVISNARYTLRALEGVRRPLRWGFQQELTVSGELDSTALSLPIPYSTSRFARYFVDDLEITGDPRIRFETDEVTLQIGKTSRSNVRVEYLIANIPVEESPTRESLRIPILPCLSSDLRIDLSGLYEEVRNQLVLDVAHLGITQRESNTSIRYELGGVDFLSIDSTFQQAEADQTLPDLEVSTTLETFAQLPKARTRFILREPTSDVALELEISSDWQPVGAANGSGLIQSLSSEGSLTKRRYRLLCSPNQGDAEIWWGPTNLTNGLIAVPRVRVTNASVLDEQFSLILSDNSRWRLDATGPWLELLDSNRARLDSFGNRVSQIQIPPTAPSGLLRRATMDSILDIDLESTLTVKNASLEIESRVEYRGETIPTTCRLVYPTRVSVESFTSQSVGVVATYDDVQHTTMVDIPIVSTGSMSTASVRVVAPFSEFTETTLPIPKLLNATLDSHRLAILSDEFARYQFRGLPATTSTAANAEEFKLKANENLQWIHSSMLPLSIRTWPEPKSLPTIRRSSVLEPDVRLQLTVVNRRWLLRGSAVFTGSSSHRPVLSFQIDKDLANEIVTSSAIAITSIPGSEMSRVRLSDFNTDNSQEIRFEIPLKAMSLDAPQFPKIRFGQVPVDQVVIWVPEQIEAQFANWSWKSLKADPEMNYVEEAEQYRAFRPTEDEYSIEILSTEATQQADVHFAVHDVFTSMTRTTSDQQVTGTSYFALTSPTAQLIEVFVPEQYDVLAVHMLNRTEHPVRSGDRLFVQLVECDAAVTIRLDWIQTAASEIGCQLPSIASSRSHPTFTRHSYNAFGKRLRKATGDSPSTSGDLVVQARTREQWESNLKEQLNILFELGETIQKDWTQVKRFHWMEGWIGLTESFFPSDIPSLLQSFPRRIEDRIEESQDRDTVDFYLNVDQVPILKAENQVKRRGVAWVRTNPIVFLFSVGCLAASGFVFMRFGPFAAGGR